MPMDNSLNVSELLKRLGVVGDSLASAPLLEEMRLAINLADFSDLVPPMGVPIAGADILSTAAGANHNQWNLQCMSPGGLTVFNIHSQSSAILNVWISDTNPFVVPTLVPHADLTFQNPAESIFNVYLPALPVAPPGHFGLKGAVNTMLLNGNWVGPGQFFNVESESNGQSQQLCSIMWKEYPAMLNPRG